jgi:hypothetical protein
MKPNLTASERFVRLILAAVLLFVGLVVFKHPLAQVAAVLAAVYCLWECWASRCPAHAALGINSPTDRKPEVPHFLALLAIQGLLAYEWLHAGWGKVSTPDFVRNLAKTFSAFAAKNPYGWYKAFLEGFATRNATLFAYAIELSQLVIGLTLLAAIGVMLYAKTNESRRAAMFAATVALFGGALMNANFYLASGWMSPSSSGLNLVMFWIQVTLASTWLSAASRSK